MEQFKTKLKHKEFQTKNGDEKEKSYTNQQISSPQCKHHVMHQWNQIRRKFIKKRRTISKKR